MASPDTENVDPLLIAARADAMGLTANEMHNLICYLCGNAPASVERGLDWIQQSRDRDQGETADPPADTPTPTPVEIPARPDVRIGDVVYVPRGADAVCTTPHRVFVEKIGSWAVSGYRIKADGTPINSRSTITADERGYLPGVVIWKTVAKSTILRDGVTVYTPPERNTGR